MVISDKILTGSLCLIYTAMPLPPLSILVEVKRLKHFYAFLAVCYKEDIRAQTTKKKHIISTTQCDYVIFKFLLIVIL